VGGVTVLVLLCAGVLQLVIAAGSYPGGSWVDPSQPGHHLWANFVCDLGRDNAVNGHSNPGAGWGRSGQWTLTLATAAFWWMLPVLFPIGRSAQVVRAAGAISTLGFLLVPLTSEVPHALALLAAGLPGLLAAVIGTLALRPRVALASLGWLALSLSAIDLVLYLHHREGLVPLAVPLLQRLALSAAVCWMAACAVAVLWSEPAPGEPRARFRDHQA
jgi:hypothetical protein